MRRCPRRSPSSPQLTLNPLLASYPTLEDFRIQMVAMKGAGMSRVPDAVLRERFGLVTGAARDNLGASIDVVLVHNDKEIRGRQPRTSLNRAVVVMAVTALDRFAVDTPSAFKTDSDYPLWGSGLMTQRPGPLRRPSRRAAHRRGRDRGAFSPAPAGKDGDELVRRAHAGDREPHPGCPWTALGPDVRPAPEPVGDSPVRPRTRQHPPPAAPSRRPRQMAAIPLTASGRAAR